MIESQDATLYELLEVDPGATEEEIRRAYKRLAALFDPEGCVIYGLYRTSEAERVLARLRAAYQTLVDPEQRREYDRRLYPRGHPSLRRADDRRASRPPAPRPEPPSDPVSAAGLGPDDPITGEAIANIRTVCGLSLEDVADRTKISMFTLRCIESEGFRDLPAPVYLRAFLRQVAALIRVEPDRLVRDYLARVEAWRLEESRRKPW